MSKSLLYSTISFYLTSSLMGAFTIIISSSWSLNINSADKRSIFYIYMIIVLISSVLNAFYFKKRAFILPAISTFIIALIGLPIIYLLNISKPDLFSPNNFLPILGLFYLIGFLLYGLSFILPSRVKKFNFLKLHGISCLITLALILANGFISITYWEIVLILISSLFLILHFFYEQHSIALEDETVLDADEAATL